MNFVFLTVFILYFLHNTLCTFETVKREPLCYAWGDFFSFMT